MLIFLGCVTLYLINKEITAFAGIGNPTNFFDLLKENKLNVKRTFSFPDHHNYTQKDFEKITGDKSTKIFTTKKDYFRLNNKQKEICEYVEIYLEIENKDKLESLIKLLWKKWVLRLIILWFQLLVKV